MAEAVKMGDSAFETEVLAITQEIMQSGEIEEIFRDKIKAGFEKAIEDSFRWGDLNRAIKERVEEAMVPFIKEYDFGDYLVKIDVLLQEIADQTGLKEHKEIIGAFRSLMSAPKYKEISLEELFAEYCKHVASSCDTDGLEVDFDDGSHYESIAVQAEVAQFDHRRSSYWDYAVLDFHAEGQEELCYTVTLRRWRATEDNYTVEFHADPSLKEIPHYDDFEILLIALTRFGTKLVCSEYEMEEWVTPDAEPEPSY